LTLVHFFKFFLCLVFFFIQSHQIFSGNSFPLEKLLEESSDNRISAKPYWHKLLHFYHPGESIGQWSTRSDVISPSFFLHPQGNTDPELELQATLEAILVPVGEDPDQHVRCRFISLKA